MLLLFVVAADTHGQERLGQVSRGDPGSLSAGRPCSAKGRWEAASPASTPAALRAADASTLGEVKCLITGALEAQHRAQHSSGSAP